MLVQTEKDAWIEALRSGKYKQGRGLLVSKISGQVEYCCLGVLCKINGLTLYDKYGSALSIPIPSEIDLGVDSGVENLYASFKLNGLPDIGEHLTLTSANDAGVSFLEIADHLEQFLPVKAASESPS